MTVPLEYSAFLAKNKNFAVFFMLFRYTLGLRLSLGELDAGDAGGPCNQLLVLRLLC